MVKLTLTNKEAEYIHYVLRNYQPSTDVKSEVKQEFKIIKSINNKIAGELNK